jgi:hypothetical protein
MLKVVDINSGGMFWLLRGALCEAGKSEGGVCPRLFQHTGAA